MLKAKLFRPNSQHAKSSNKEHKLYRSSQLLHQHSKRSRQQHDFFYMANVTHHKGLLGLWTMEGGLLPSLPTSRAGQKQWR